MAAGTPLLPPLVPGMTLTARHFEASEDYLEWVAALGRGPLLLDSAPGPLVYQSGSNVLRVKPFIAVGRAGYPICNDPAVDWLAVEGFDSSSLPEGEFDLIACLSRDREPCGPIWQEEYPDEWRATIQAPAYRQRQVVLSLAAERGRYLDSIQVGRFRRVRVGRICETQVETRFYPPVSDMRIFGLANPLRRLAERGLDLLAESATNDVNEALRLELRLLQNVARAGRPDVAQVQAQRCLMQLRTLRPCPLPLVGAPEDMEFHAETFWEFLAALAEALDRDQHGFDLFPAQLRMRDQSFQRVNGTLEPQPDGYLWQPPGGGDFNLNALAIYFPRALACDLPHLKYSTSRATSDRPTLDRYPLGKFETLGTATGTLVILEAVTSSLRELFVTANTAGDLVRLGQRLADGHALYYR